VLRTRGRLVTTKFQENLEGLDIESVGAADTRRHALENGGVMAVIADHLLPEVTHFMSPGGKIVLGAGPPRL
jgi:hypothetical protein